MHGRALMRAIDLPNQLSPLIVFRLLENEERFPIKSRCQIRISRARPVTNAVTRCSGIYLTTCVKSAHSTSRHSAATRRPRRFWSIGLQSGLLQAPDRVVSVKSHIGRLVRSDLKAKRVNVAGSSPPSVISAQASKRPLVDALDADEIAGAGSLGFRRRLKE